MRTSVLLSALLAASLVPAASAAPHGIMWTQGHVSQLTTRPKAGGSLQYYGGPVIANAKVYAVFWGANVAPETKSKIGSFFTNMLDSTYMDWLQEYDTNVAAVDGRQGTNQHIGRGKFAGNIQITPKNRGTKLTDQMIQAELEGQLAAGKLPAADGDSLYMIYFPAGISITIEKEASCQTFCAYHEGFKAKSGASVFYGVMPVCGFGCGFSGSAFDDLTVVSSHEAIEAITDPFPTPGSTPSYPQAWNTTDGQEIGDLCAQGMPSTVTGHGVTSQVQAEWDNSTGACNQGPWQQNLRAPRLPIATAAPKMPLLSALRTNAAGVWAGR